MSKKYNFTVESLYILLEILEKNSNIFDIADKNTSDIIKTITKAIVSSKDETVKIMAIALDKKETDILAMDAVSYLDEVVDFVGSLDWESIMGKLTSLMARKEVKQEI